MRHDLPEWPAIVFLQSIATLRSAAESTRGIYVFQIKAVIRGSKVSERAASATDALRRFKEIQARAGVTACTVMKGGVLVAPAELLSAATVEEIRARSGL